jgi:PPP family 3-phenylpropionic acid transporter
VCGEVQHFFFESGGIDMFRISLYTCLLFTACSVTVFYLPVLFQEKGFSNSEIGLMMGVSSLISVMAQPFWGLVSDRYRTIKKVLILLMLGSMLFSLPLFIGGRQFAVMILFIILFQMFHSSVLPMSESLMVRYAYEHQRTFGAIRAWGDFGIGIGALLVGYALDVYGVAFLAWFYIGMLSVTLLSAARIEDAQAHAVPVSRESIRKLMSNRRFFLFLVTMLIFAIPHRINDSFLPLYLKELGAPDSMVGKAWLVATLCSVPALYLVGRFIQRYGEMACLTFAGVIYIIRWVIYSIVPDPVAIMYAQALHMLTYPVFLTAAVLFIFRIVPRELASTGQTMFAATFGGIGGIIGNSLGGRMMDTIGSGAMYMGGAALCLVGLVIFLALVPYFKSADQATGSTGTSANRDI